MKKTATAARRTATQPMRARSTIIAASVAVALSQFAAIAHADSGVGQDTLIGNALNPRAINPANYGMPPDPEGLGATYAPAAHTPTGQMYDIPLQVREPNRTESGWTWNGNVEFGLFSIHGDRKRQGFTRYKDVDNGPVLNNLAFSAENADSARFLEFSGGAVGQDDQFYSAQFGRYNDWKVRAFYNETTHTFTTTWRSLHSGAGTGRLTVSPTAQANGLAAGNTTAAQSVGTFAANANAALAATPESRLGITRSKGGVRADLNLLDNWKVFASFTSEKREGARPFSATFGANGGGQHNIEIAEPIDYRTNDMVAGIQYADKLNAFNFTVNASWFRNHISSLTFDNIIPTNGANGAASFPQGTFDLYPDNDYYSAKGEYARHLPDLWKGRFTAVVSLATSRQNDRLQPFTNDPSVTVAGLNNWHTTDSLSRKHAGARIDTKLVDLGLSLNPLDTLNVKGKIRYYETSNDTDFLLCNSGAGGAAANTLTGYGCTGVWGRLVNDGAGSSLINTGPGLAAGNIYIRNIPFDYKQLNYGVDADYRFGKANSFSAGYERETFNRDHREREKTWEDKFKFGYVNRSLDDGTVRLSYEHGRRRGSHYDAHHALIPFYSGYLWSLADAIANGSAPVVAGTALPNATSWVVHMNSRMRKYDLADRNQNTLNARFNYMLRHDLDIGIATQFKDTEYPNSDYGRVDHQRQNSVNFDISWQPNERTNLYAFYSWQQSKLKQQAVPSGALAGMNCGIGNNGLTVDNAAYLCADPNTGRVFNVANNYTQTHRDTTDTLGFGLRQVVRDMVLDANYTYSLGRTKIGYTLPANFAAASVALAGSGFEDLKTTSHTLELSLTKPISKTVSARLLYRHERGKIDDWHYNGLPTALAFGANPGAALFADGGAQDYRVNFFGALLNVGF